MPWTESELQQLRDAAATGARVVELQMADGTRRRVEYQTLAELLDAIARAEASTSTAPRRSLIVTSRAWGRR